ncbi:alternate-type signal peptide domain-containing protein [Tomitella biformata]|uniref:alternate-type signal peptide domain-containing protein n=1 Tax=Tomitella biformata TaxID=630403 RepID=UPI0004660C8A|nr:alternate-type signal peptide domain-containing protein [Tomitella biformata]
MKKTTKGAVAAGAAALLLAGGAGSFAAWNASGNTTGAGTVTAGSMAVAETSAGVWTWASGSKVNTAFDQVNDKLVPGDKVKYTSTYNVTLSGTNLKAELIPSLGNLTGDLKTNDRLTVSSSDTNASPIIASGPVSFTTEVEFKSDTTGQDGFNETATIGAGTVLLEQVLTP